MVRERQTVSLSGSLLLTHPWGIDLKDEQNPKEDGSYVINNHKQQELKESK